MEVACAMELRPNPKPVSHNMVGTYDPPSNDIASKCVIELHGGGGGGVNEVLPGMVMNHWL